MKHFGQWLKAARNEAGLSFRKLEALINGICTYSYLAQLERGDRGKKGQTYQPDRDIVIAIAKALNKPVDDALLAAGYAPKTIARRPETIPELVAALEQLGIEAPQPFGGYPKDDDGEGYREVV